MEFWWNKHVTSKGLEIQLKKQLRNGCLGYQVYIKIFKKVGSCQLSTVIVLQYCIQNENTIPSSIYLFTFTYFTSYCQVGQIYMQSSDAFSRNPIGIVNRREAKYCQWTTSDPPVFKEATSCGPITFPEWAKLTMSTVVNPRSLLLNQKKICKGKRCLGKASVLCWAPFCESIVLPLKNKHHRRDRSCKKLPKHPGSVMKLTKITKNSTPGSLGRKNWPKFWPPPSLEKWKKMERLLEAKKNKVWSK